jgi:hypothetical protein
MSPENRTERDAHERITQAQIGAHVDASDTFLVALRARLYLWIANIDAELARRDRLRVAIAKARGER